MPIFVVTTTHASDQCPLTNLKTRELFKRNLTEGQTAAQKYGIKYIAGPLFSLNHKDIIVLEAPKVESVIEGFMASKIPQWNSVDIQPYMTAEDISRIASAQEAAQ
jgi:hypothetical protein